VKKYRSSLKLEKIRITALIFIIIIIAASNILFLSGCKNYVSDEDFNSIIARNDIVAEFKMKKNKDHECTVNTHIDPDKEVHYIEIEVRENLSITTGRTSIEPGKYYRLSVVMKNHSSDPLILYSFWEDSVTESRSYTLAGENGNPPISETQEIHKDWVEYAEMFKAIGKEAFFKLSIVSNSGVFFIRSISIEEIAED